MSRSSVAQDGHTRPRRRVLLAQLAKLAKPLRAFMATEAGSAGLLLTATAVALIWAKTRRFRSRTSRFHLAVFC